MTAYRLITSAFLAATCLGCTPTRPEMVGSIAPCPQENWCPPKRVCRPVLVTEKIAPEDASDELSAEELIDIALRNNPNTGRSWYTARAAAYDVGVAKSTLYPQVQGTETLEASSIYGNFVSGGGGGDGSGRGHTQSEQSALTLSYLMLDFGGRCAEISAAYHALYSANWTHNRTLQDVIIDTLQAYYDHLFAIGLAEAAREDLRDNEKNLEAAKAQFTVGVATHLDVLQAQSNTANAKLSLATAEGAIKATMGRLAASLGWPADTSFSVVPAPKEIALDTVQADMETLLWMARDARPDLEAVYSDYLRSKDKVASAISDALPTVAFAGVAQRTHFFANSRLDGSSQSGAIIVSAPLFTGFFFENEIASRKQVAKSLCEAVRVKETQVLLEVATAYTVYETSVQTVQFSKEFESFAQEAYDAAFEGYKLGTNSILDVLTAQFTLSEARRRVIQAKTVLLSSIARIAYTVGTL